jgi:hypothetical protein
MLPLWHELLEPEAARTMDSRGYLWVQACSCGYRSSPGTKARAKQAAEAHYEGVMSARWVWIVGCTYCAVKSVSNSRPGAFLMWLGHWADAYQVGDPQHGPLPPEPPTDDMYEGVRLSKRHVELMGERR